MTTDRDVVLRSWEDPAAFGELFEHHATTIHRVVARRISPAAADDVVAETFLRAFERRRRFSPDHESALPWLFGFAMHVLRHHQRAQRRLVQHDVEHPDATDRVAMTGERIDAERRLDAVLSTLDRMPTGTREVVLLHLVADLSYAETAEALHVPIGTVRSRLARARMRLRALDHTPDTTGDGHGLGGAAPFSL